ncbi:complement C1q-like protein 2 isoform X3 [Thalassophryne amazonica]|uniref:complement C1q-like protein 2 isoform X3 n=1 Tax=Thalassophryne amazonica TaxID=390379 RepID=UPI001471DB23|nr:complement C1q-like protein 2 isoform X3 [Thalassophryne amazonica]
MICGQNSTAQTSKLLDLERDVIVRHSGLDVVNEACQAELWAVTLRLNSTEYQIHHLTTEHTVLQVRVRGSEAAVHQLDSHIEDVGIRLNSTDRLIQELQSDTADVSSRLNVTEDQLEQLRNTNADDLKVAFSVGLSDSGSVGPFDEEQILIFTKIFFNVGRAYNQTAGVFTAPLRGVYFFSFTAADFLKGYMGVYLYKNRQPVTFSLDLNDHGGYASTSSGVTLQLDKGDVVCLRLPASYRLYDDSRNFSIFSGFLLFPL